MQTIRIFNQFDSPWNFKTSNQVEEWRIEYNNLIEINQGAPLVGNLCINGNYLQKKYLFGSPFIYADNSLYIPIFIRRFCLSGFILSKIDLATARISYISKIKNLIYLDSLQNNTLMYYTDIEKKNKEYLYIGR